MYIYAGIRHSFDITFKPHQRCSVDYKWTGNLQGSREIAPHPLGRSFLEGPHFLPISQFLYEGKAALSVYVTH